eukprot:4458436-Pleurochrysis_carterae.AAC.1
MSPPLTGARQPTGCSRCWQGHAGRSHCRGAGRVTAAGSRCRLPQATSRSRCATSQRAQRRSSRPSRLRRQAPWRGEQRTRPCCSRCAPLRRCRRRRARRRWPRRRRRSAVSRLVSASNYGAAAWAAIFSDQKFSGVLPSEGVVPFSVPSARQCLYSLVLSRIEDVVSEVRLPGVEAELAKLAEAVLTADVELELAVKLLGGLPPDRSERRAATYGSKITGGRWGRTEGLSAPADICDGMQMLGELLGMAHALAGGGARCPSPDFHLMVELARRACVAEGSMPLAKGVKLLEDVFLGLRRAAKLRRTRRD